MPSNRSSHHPTNAKGCESKKWVIHIFESFELQQFFSVSLEINDASVVNYPDERFIKYVQLDPLVTQFDPARSSEVTISKGSF